MNIFKEHMPLELKALAYTNNISKSKSLLTMHNTKNLGVADTMVKTSVFNGNISLYNEDWCVVFKGNTNGDDVISLSNFDSLAASSGIGKIIIPESDLINNIYGNGVLFLDDTGSMGFMRKNRFIPYPIYKTEYIPKNDFALSGFAEIATLDTKSISNLLRQLEKTSDQYIYSHTGGIIYDGNSVKICFTDGRLLASATINDANPHLKKINYSGIFSIDSFLKAAIDAESINSNEVTMFCFKDSKSDNDYVQIGFKAKDLNLFRFGRAFTVDDILIPSGFYRGNDSITNADHDALIYSHQSILDSTFKNPYTITLPKEEIMTILKRCNDPFGSFIFNVDKSGTVSVNTDWIDDEKPGTFISTNIKASTWYSPTRIGFSAFYLKKIFSNITNNKKADIVMQFDDPSLLATFTLDENKIFLMPISLK